MDSLQYFFSNIYFLVLLSVCISFFLSRNIIPAIIYLSKKKNLMDMPGERSSHVNKTPTLGGIGIFISFSLTLILLAIFSKLEQHNLITLLTVIFGCIVLVFLGIKDDLLALSPLKKIIGQLIASVLVVLSTDIKISNLYGILGIGELSPVLSIIVTVFIFLFVINAYNLTDGIDGLAASIAIVSCISFGVFFLANLNYLMTFISFSLAGALFSFILYNLSNTKKIFMGDSGSMVVGFLLAFLGTAMFVVNGKPIISFSFNSVPIMFFAIFAFPILDTTRVFFIRLRQGRSPFSADRNHIHHKLIDLGLNHQSATFIIYNINIVIIVFALILDVLQLNINIKLLIMICTSLSLYLFPFFLKEKKGKIKLAVPYLQ